MQSRTSSCQQHRFETMNVNCEKTDGRPENPVESASFLSKCSFWWLKDLFRQGLVRPIEQNDIYSTLKVHESKRLSDHFTAQWNREKQTTKPNLFRVMRHIYAKKILGLGIFFTIVDTISRIIQPQCLGGLVTYFSPGGDKELSKNDAYLFAAGIVLCSVCSITVFHPFILYAFQLGMRVRLTCCSLIYKKALKLTKSVAVDGLNGQVINLMSNDVARFDVTMGFVHDLWKGPLELVLMGYFIYREIGYYGLTGIGFLLCFLPIQTWIGRRAATYRLRTAKRTDRRVRIMNEIIQAIQVIKMYTWEKSFASLVDKIRKKELRGIRGTLFIRGTLLSFNIISRFSIFVSLITYVYFGNVFTARKVFIVTSYFNFLYSSVLHFWPLAISSVAEAFVSIQRVQDFLLLPENKDAVLLNRVRANGRAVCVDDEMEKLLSNGGEKLADRQVTEKPPPIAVGGGGGGIGENDIKVIVNDVNGVDKATVVYKNIKNLSNDHCDALVAAGEGDRRRTVKESANKKSVVFKDATAGWLCSNSGSNTGKMGRRRYCIETLYDKRGMFCLFFYARVHIGIENINLDIVAGRLCAVVGIVGAGKSTLLQVILGELELDAGTLAINGSVSYAPQEPWLFEGTIRQNILFIEDYDEKRYKEVVKVCALERDFELFPHEDATIVGERGVSLSGGQRARVNLARAIYKQADIYLLDDPLSAVDTHVGKHIFEKCIKQYLKGKVCVLVTHQLQYLKDVQQTVLMYMGRIEAQGSYDLLKTSRNHSLLWRGVEEQSQELNDEQIQEEEVIKPIRVASTDVQNDNKESQIIGTVGFQVYISYFMSVNSYVFLLVVAILFILAQGAISSVDLLVSKWVNWEDQLRVSRENASQLLNESRRANDSLVTKSNDDALNILIDSAQGYLNHSAAVDEIWEERNHYITTYSIAMLVVLYLVFQRSFAFFQMCLVASRRLHDKLFRGITRGMMYFFNTNPSGRILNRFSKDIGNVDTILPVALMDCLLFFLELIAIIVLVSMVNYWLLLPTFVMSLLFYGLRHIYVNTARCIKRVEALTRSPIFSHANATLQGLSTIRAFKAEQMVANEFDAHQDLNTSSWYLFLASTRAFALWLELVCVLYMATVILSFLLLGNDTMGGNVGLAITQIFNLIIMCQWGMRQTAELENQMTSVERINEYANMKPEPSLESIPKCRPPERWPQYGAVRFNGLSMKYDESGSCVLRDLTFNIEPQEKIGIVGRTGAGKSSIIQAMFRLAINEGSVEIDDIDTATLGLHDLRSKISIIPQDPILFSGNMRNNLDPFADKSDDDIWNALAQVELKQMVSQLPGGLDCTMSDGGSNFSMGQRQLVCLARAILRNNNILILDEATANVDAETDNLIQTTIRTQFGHCTVLTIAHRLHTVMDSDRVLVMDAGRVVEFAHPHILLQRGGFLRKLVDQTGSITASYLIHMAAQNYKKTSTDL